MNTYIKYIAFILVFVILGMPKSMGQTVEKLVRFHKNTRSVMATSTRKKIKDKIFVMYGYDNKDTLYINNVAQDSLVGKYSTLKCAFISSFDIDHNILKTGVIQTDKGRQIGYENFMHFGDRIFLSLFMDGDQVIYNGEIVWQGKELGLHYYTRYLVLELDLDLNYKNLYIFDHFNSGIQAIAVQEERLHVFGHMINERAGKIDTIEVEGHRLTSTSDEEKWATHFTLTFDTNTGELLNELKINAGYYSNTGFVEQVRISEDGDVYQLMRTTANTIILEGQIYGMTDYVYNTYLLKFNKDGKLISKAFFTVNYNGVDIQQMELTKDGDVILFGDAKRGFGVNGRQLTEFPYLDAAIILRLDGETLEPEWYDYYAVEKKDNLTLRSGGMTMDNKENIYVVNSHGRAVINAEDKEGNKLESGVHLFKYNAEGKKLNDYHYPSLYGARLYPAALGVDTLLFFTGFGGPVGTYDSVFHLTKLYKEEVNLFQYVLHGQVTDVDYTEKTNGYKIFPNPVQVGNEVSIIGSENILSATPYVLVDTAGRIHATGVTDGEGAIKIPEGIRSGIYYVSGTGKAPSFSAKIVVIE